MYISNCHKVGGATRPRGVIQGWLDEHKRNEFRKGWSLWLAWLVGSSALLFVGLGFGIGICSAFGRRAAAPSKTSNVQSPAYKRAELAAAGDSACFRKGPESQQLQLNLSIAANPTTLNPKL